jgi:hypothetical protein
VVWTFEIAAGFRPGRYDPIICGNTEELMQNREERPFQGRITRWR